MICPVTWEPDIPADIRAIVEPVLKHWDWLVPTWCQEFDVRYNPMKDARMAVTVNYHNRWAVLHVTGQWFGEPEDMREMCLVHELIHIFLEALTAPVGRIIEGATEEDSKERALADRMFADGMEQTVADLAHCLIHPTQIRS